MKYLLKAKFETETEEGIELTIDGLHSLNIRVLEEDIFRVTLKKNKEFIVNKTWGIAPGLEDIPAQGFDREQSTFFNYPRFKLQKNQDTIDISSEKIQLQIKLDPLKLTWINKETGKTLAEDRNYAYALGRSTQNIWHYLKRSSEDQYFGLGEKSGPLNKALHQYEMKNIDAMGYDASSSDPLYKHYPYFIKHSSAGSCAFYYDNYSTSQFNFGKELDNYHGHFSSYKAEAGDLDFYFIHDHSIKNIVKRFSWLTGKTLMPPRWSLGYSGSTMSYTDSKDANELLKGFIHKASENKVLCSSFQLSSGYTSIGDKRYVFNWNKEKIPNPSELSQYFHKNGVKLAANIKPVLLSDHPKYQEAKDLSLFIKDSESKKPEKSPFWDGHGSHLDFTNEHTRSWWKKNIKEQLLDNGIDSTWNDNNEFQVWDDEATCENNGQELPIKHIRPVQALLMMKSSFEIQKTNQPNKRPWLISRCGMPGIQRYVQTWSGDNDTSWETLKYNTFMGLNFSLSGMYNIGHDIGGFSGPAPEPELFLRWIQLGIFMPRFTIHSWNSDDSVTEPWMYPEILPIIQEQIKFRYKLIPYLYNEVYKSVHEFEPILKPLFVEFPNDLNCHSEMDSFMFGSNFLVCPVLEKDQHEVEVYLPDNKKGWFDFHSMKFHPAASRIIIKTEKDSIPLFIQANSSIPLGSGELSDANEGSAVRNIHLYLDENDQCHHSFFYDDDGESYQYKEGSFLKLYTSYQEKRLQINKEGSWIPPYKDNIKVSIIHSNGSIDQHLISWKEIKDLSCL